MCVPPIRPVYHPVIYSSRLVVPARRLARRPVLSCRGAGSSSPWRWASCHRVSKRASWRGVGVLSVVPPLVPCARLGRCEARGGGVLSWACSCGCLCVMRLVGAIRRAGRGICVVVEMSDVVAFRFSVADYPPRAPFRLLVARLI